MVRAFPQPGRAVQASLAHLQFTAMYPATSEDELHALSELERPWDPASCAPALRGQVWSWLEEVAAWVNHQHLWTVTLAGIPECWPHHPHLVHDLAAVAAARYYTRFALTPAALEEWHRITLPGFLHRISDRIGETCQPGHHQPTPRAQRDQHSASPEVAQDRQDKIDTDLRHGLRAEATRQLDTW